jgi:hypothetical protein
MTQLSDNCRKHLYRMILEFPEKQVVFMLAANRNDAWKIALRGVCAVYNVSMDAVSLYGLHSCTELIGFGRSQDEDLRIFEMAWSEDDVSEWVSSPLFLTGDPTVISRWVELQAALRNGATAVTARGIAVIP